MSEMNKQEISRRSLLLGSVAVGFGAISGKVQADNHTSGNSNRYTISVRRDGDSSAVENAARELSRTTRLADIILVTGWYSDDVLARLNQRRDVVAIEQDKTSAPPTPPPEPDTDYPHPTTTTAPSTRSANRESETSEEVTDWGFDLLGGHHLTASTNDATVAILDSGFDVFHPDIADSIVTTEVFEGTRISDEPFIHGTPIAGIVGAENNGTGTVGIAPGVNLALGKITDQQDGTAFASTIAAGIQWAVDDAGADIINISYEGPSPSFVLRSAVEYAASNDVVCISSAGNDGQCRDCVRYPAAFESVVAVSSLHRSMSVASHSSTGPEIDFIAPGESISAPTHGGGRYDRWRGTSFAAPYTAGVAALLVEEGYSGSDIVTELRRSAIDTGLTQNEQGSGRVDAWRAVTRIHSPVAAGSLTQPSEAESLSDLETIELRANTVRNGDGQLTELVEPYFVAYLPAHYLTGDDGVEGIWNPNTEQYEEMVSVGHTQTVEPDYDTRVTIDLSATEMDRLKEDNEIDILVLMIDADWGKDDEVDRWRFSVSDAMQNEPGDTTPSRPPTRPDTTQRSTQTPVSPGGSSDSRNRNHNQESAKTTDSDERNETVGEVGAGFGISSAVAALSGIGYILKRRYDTEAEET